MTYTVFWGAAAVQHLGTRFRSSSAHLVECTDWILTLYPEPSCCEMTEVTIVNTQSYNELTDWRTDGLTDWRHEWMNLLHCRAKTRIYQKLLWPQCQWEPSSPPKIKVKNAQKYDPINKRTKKAFMCSTITSSLYTWTIKWSKPR